MLDRREQDLRAREAELNQQTATRLGTRGEGAQVGLDERRAELDRALDATQRTRGAGAALTRLGQSLLTRREVVGSPEPGPQPKREARPRPEGLEALREAASHPPAALASAPWP